MFGQAIEDGSEEFEEETKKVRKKTRKRRRKGDDDDDEDCAGSSQPGSSCASPASSSGKKRRNQAPDNRIRHNLKKLIDIVIKYTDRYFFNSLVITNHRSRKIQICLPSL